MRPGSRRWFGRYGTAVAAALFVAAAGFASVDDSLAQTDQKKDRAQKNAAPPVKGQVQQRRNAMPNGMVPNRGGFRGQALGPNAVPNARTAPNATNQNLDPNLKGPNARGANAANPHAYTMRIVRNLAIERFRRADVVRLDQGAMLQMAEVPDLEPTPDRVAIDRSELAHVVRTMQDMPPRMREALYLRRIEGLPPGQVAVGADGALSLNGAVAAAIGLFEFPEGTQLKAEGANRYVAPEDANVSRSGNSVIHQGELEGANQDVIQGSLDLLMMQRQAEMMQKTLTIFHTEFNKFASEDLPRV